MKNLAYLNHVLEINFSITIVIVSALSVLGCVDKKPEYFTGYEDLLHSDTSETDNDKKDDNTDEQGADGGSETDTEAGSNDDMGTDAGSEGESSSDNETDTIEVDTFSALRPGPDGLFINGNVMIIGDNIFAQSNAIRKNLEELSNERYRYYPKSNAQISGGSLFGKPIPIQYSNAKADGPARTVIMDGGGNDIIVGGQFQCYSFSASCAAIVDEVKQAGLTLLGDMEADGVQNVIWLGNYYTNSVVMTGATGQKKALDSTMEAIEQICDGYTGLECHFVDSREAFQNKPGLIKTDGINPTDEGSEILATLIWETMQENNIEQNEH